MVGDREGRRGFLKSLGCGLVLGFFSVLPLGKKAEIVEEPEKEKIKDVWSKVEQPFWEYMDTGEGTILDPLLVGLDYSEGKVICKWLDVSTDSSDGLAGFEGVSTNA